MPRPAKVRFLAATVEMVTSAVEEDAVFFGGLVRIFNGWLLLFSALHEGMSIEIQTL